MALDTTLDDLSKVLTACMHDAQVFERDVSSGGLLEVESFRKENKRWLAAAAGISDEESSRLFQASPARAERSTIPLNIVGGGQASFYFVLRPLEFPIEEPSIFKRAAHFAPQDGIPLVEIRDAHFHLSNLPGDNNLLNHLRWELDLPEGHKDPLEPWLRPWKKRIGCNPAHPPSHMHFNAPPLDSDSVVRDRRDHSGSELRLAVGVPNPLTLILSVAAWIRQP